MEGRFSEFKEEHQYQTMPNQSLPVIQQDPKSVLKLWITGAIFSFMIGLFSKYLSTLFNIGLLIVILYRIDKNNKILRTQTKYAYHQIKNI